MKLQVRGEPLLLSEAQRLELERRFALRLGRFGDEIDKMTIHFSDVPESHKRCRIVIALRPRLVRVESSDADLSVAVDRAAERAERAIERAIKRARESDLLGK